MTGSSNQLIGSRQTRSFSLPSKSNLINKKIEEELEKLRIKEESSSSTAETISIGFSGLADLYSCINQVLILPLTQQALSVRHHEKYVAEFLKVCSCLQNFSSSTRELLLQQKKLIVDTLSELSTSTQYEDRVASYASSRKKMIKKSKGLIRSLKQLLEDESFGSPRLFEKEDPRVSTLIKALTCVSIINASVYESLLFFLSSPVSKPTIGSIVSKLIHKSNSKSIRHTKGGNEFRDVDIALRSLSLGVNGEKVQNAQRRLQDSVTMIEDIANRLDNAYVQLIETKACIMKIISF